MGTMNQVQDIIEACLRTRWGIGPEVRKIILERQVAIATAGDDKNAVRAFRAILKADELDLEAVKMALVVAGAEPAAVDDHEVVSRAELELGLRLLAERAVASPMKIVAEEAVG